MPPEARCATFEHYFLRACSGKCPDCGTQVLVQVADPDPWNTLADDSDIMEFSIDNFEVALSVRTQEVLRVLGVRTVGDLVKRSVQEIKAQAKASQRTVDELVEVVLEPKGLTLR